MVWRQPRFSGVYVASMALLIGGLTQYLIESNLFKASGAQVQWGLEDIVFKLNEYWAAYFFCFPQQWYSSGSITTLRSRLRLRLYLYS